MGGIWSQKILQECLDLLGLCNCSGEAREIFSFNVKSLSLSGVHPQSCCRGQLQPDSLQITEDSESTEAAEGDLSVARDEGEAVISV